MMVSSSFPCIWLKHALLKASVLPDNFLFSPLISKLSLLQVCVLAVVPHFTLLSSQSRPLLHRLQFKSFTDYRLLDCSFSKSYKQTQFEWNFRRTRIKQPPYQVSGSLQIRTFFFSPWGPNMIFLHLTIIFSWNISKPFKLSRIIEISCRIISPNTWMPAKLLTKENDFLLSSY